MAVKLFVSDYASLQQHDDVGSRTIVASRKGLGSGTIIIDPIKPKVDPPMNRPISWLHLISPKVRSFEGS